MENYREKICSCALNRIFGFSPKVALALMTHFGSASEIFRLQTKDIDNLLGPYSKHRGLIRPDAVYSAEKELEELERMNVCFVGWNDGCYPELLKECEDAPVGIYIRSTTAPEELFSSRRSIAVVGTRDISPYGKDWCARTVEEISRSADKPVIVSGLAIGTDYYAHKTALECGLPTIGVMATGPETVYPLRHRDFAERLYRTPGCALITDYPPGTAPLAPHFLRRNRIIAGLSDSTILIESKIKGGGMMTSRLAFSYNRDVYALPGRIDDICSQGCNYLIRNKMAEPITSIDDLMKSLGLGVAGTAEGLSGSQRLEAFYRDSMPPEQITLMSDIFKMIMKERGISIEDISISAGLPYHKVANAVNIMETDGFISIDLLQRCMACIRK